MKISRNLAARRLASLFELSLIGRDFFNSYVFLKN